MGSNPAAGTPGGSESAVDWRRVSSLVVGQAAVQAGSFALLIAMSWTAVQLGGRGAVTVVTLAATVPRALLLLFGGALTDVLGPGPSSCAPRACGSPSWWAARSSSPPPRRCGRSS
ncbi:hypothetical protein ACFQ60_43165 [Streptomyces zhihengii]